METPFFIHIPKTAGHYIGRSLNFSFNHLYFNKPLPKNLSTNDWEFRNLTRETLGVNYFSFAFTRNPFDFLVSWYHYITQNGLWDIQSLPQLTFPNFLYLVSEGAEIYPGKRFLSFQLFGSDGRLIVDFLGRIENFQEDFAAIVNKYGYKTLEVHQDNRNISRHKDYRFYYDDALVDIVNKLYVREMKIFGYSFEGHTTPEIELPWISREERLRYSYDHGKDVLKCDGQIISKG